MDGKALSWTRMSQTKGDSALRQKDYASAQSHFTRAIALAPTADHDLMVALLCRRAVALLHLKKHKKCVSDCSAAVAMDPLSFRAHVVRALGHAYLSNFTQALLDHEQAVALSGQNLVLLERLEEMRAALEMMRTSAVYGAARGSAANTVDWIGDFGLLSFEPLGDRLEESDAKRRKEEASHGLPKLIPVGEWMGMDVCEQLLDHTSYKLGEKAVKEKQKGNAEFASGNYRRALQLYTRAIKLNPDDALFYSNRALVYMKLGRYEEAVSDCSASIVRGPTIKAYARRAAAYDALKRHVDAARDHRQSLAFEPRNPGCLAAFRECLEAMLAQQPPVPEEERAMARRDLEDIKTNGRLSEDSLASQSLPPTAEAASGNNTPVPDTPGEKKKRTAGGFHS